MSEQTKNPSKKHGKKVFISVLAVLLAAVLIAAGVIFLLIPEKRYRDAMAAVEAEKYREACELFAKLGKYRDSEEQLAELNEKQPFLTIYSANPGGTVYFGQYRQSVSGSSAPRIQNIEWIVLEKKDNKLMLISKYCLESHDYNGGSVEKTTWEKCSMRSFLNKTFYFAAFSKTERPLIATVTNTNPDSERYGTSGGEDTEDQVFLLSEEEVKKYFPTDEARRAEPSPMIKNIKDFYTDQATGTCWWWTRTPGNDGCCGTRVQPDGAFNYSVRVGGDGVRPVIWVDLTA